MTLGKYFDAVCQLLTNLVGGDIKFVYKVCKVFLDLLLVICTVMFCDLYTVSAYLYELLTPVLTLLFSLLRRHCESGS